MDSDEDVLDLGAQEPSGALESHYWAAVYEGDTTTIGQFLLGDADNDPEPGFTLELVDARGLPTFHRLAVIGLHTPMRFLLEAAGADVNQREPTYGQTGMHMAATKGHVDVVQMLLDSGADPFAADTAGGWTPLHAAARAGQDEVIAVLLDNSPPELVNVRALSLDTALHRAAYWGRLSTVRLLMERGADRFMLNADGHDAVGVACKGPTADMSGLATIRSELLLNKPAA